MPPKHVKTMSRGRGRTIAMKKTKTKRRTLKKIIILEVVVLTIAILALAIRTYYENTLEKIDLSNYPTDSIDYGDLSDAERETVDAILEAIETKEKFIPSSLSEESLKRVWFYFHWHYDAAIFNWTIDFNWIYPDAVAFEKAERKMALLDAQIDEALSEMYEGSDRFKLWQISKYLADKISYKLEQPRALPAWESGEGNCQTYAKIFYRMASRLGIQSYICTSGDHCWNMVELDGVNYFYDVCYYDGDGCCPMNNIWFLHSKNAWGRYFELTAPPIFAEKKG